MGLFDNIKVDYALPDIGGAPLDDNETTFQSKSMDFPCLDTYVIREDGSLWLSYGPDREEEDIPRQIRFSGSIVFYSRATIHKSLRFKALFDTGTLVWIKVLKDGDDQY